MKVISALAIGIGGATCLSGLICFLGSFWCAVSPLGDFDFIGLFWAILTIPLYCFLFWPLAAVGFVLSIVALFTEPNERLQGIGLVLVIFGICLFLASYSL
jgi:hypothetical protein